MFSPKGGHGKSENKHDTAIPGTIRILPKSAAKKPSDTPGETLIDGNNEGFRVSQLQPPDEDLALKINLSGKYELIRKLGQGGMASVYLAREKDLAREVAIKVLPKAFLHDTNFIDRFKREARIAANLEHPNIISIFQISIEQELCYIVMSYVKGMNLAEEIARRGTLTSELIVKWGTEICSALSYAHKNGVIHRDLKPENVMIN
ncbi:serine/threonine protein kinase, partial [Candidatus Latescibacterota bacterium]